MIFQSQEETLFFSACRADFLRKTSRKRTEILHPNTWKPHRNIYFHPPYAYSVPKAMRRKYRLTDKKKARKLLHITFCPTWTSRESRISHLPPRHGQKTQPCTSGFVKLTKWNIPLHAFTKRPTSPWFSILFCNFALITVKSEKYGKIHQSLYRCRF